MQQHAAARWMDDAASNVCLLCATSFSFTNRRHHCRSCLRLVCAACSSRTKSRPNRSFARLLAPREERVCDDCWVNSDFETVEARLELKTASRDGLAEVYFDGELAFRARAENGVFEPNETRLNVLRKTTEYAYCVIRFEEDVFRVHLAEAARGRVSSCRALGLEVAMDSSSNSSSSAGRRVWEDTMRRSEYGRHEIGTLVCTPDGVEFVGRQQALKLPHSCLLELSVKPAADGWISFQLLDRTYGLHVFANRTISNRDLSWLKREIAWRTREDSFVCEVSSSPSPKETLIAPHSNGEDEKEAESSTLRGKKRRALKKFLKSSPSLARTAVTYADVDLTTEFERQGVLGDHRWRLTFANASFELCSTYPQLLVVPAAVPDETIKDAAKWRSRNRLPVLTWYNSESGSPICRSSQPLTGFGGICPEDETLLLHVRAACAQNGRTRGAIICGRQDSIPASSFDEFGSTETSTNPQQPPILRICDARPLLNAKANAAMGRGHETVSRLGGKDAATLEFLNMPNIHVVNDSFKALREALAGPNLNTNYVFPESPDNNEQSGATEGGGLLDDDVAVEDGSANASALPDDQQVSSVFKALHDSRWLHHLSALLRGADIVAEYSRQGDPVLVHCSDGWDRTAQVCAVAQFLLDPYYRTLQGFKVLVEKDFVAFGHMFRERSGVSSTAVATPWSPTYYSAPPFAVQPPPQNTKDSPLASNESSPVFLQFLDAIAQIIGQFPTIAEFDERALPVLWRAAYSRTDANFRFDSEKERQLNSSRPSYSSAPSVWPRIESFKNHLYDPAATSHLVIRPAVSLKSLFLSSMYLPHDAPPTPIQLLRQELDNALLLTRERNDAARPDDLDTVGGEDEDAT